MYHPRDDDRPVAPRGEPRILARDLVRHVVGFVGLLRGRGWHVGPGESEMALQTLRHVGLDRRIRVMHGLRTVLCRTRSEWAEFPALFDQHWNPDLEDLHGWDLPGGDPGGGTGESDQMPQLTEEQQGSAQADEAEDQDDSEDVPVYSPATILMRKDLGTVPQMEEAEVADLIRRLAENLHVRRRRRLRRAGRRGSIDLRRAFRRSLRWGGELLVLPRRARKQELGGVVVLCDVSGSMEAYGRFYLQFLHALHARMRRVHAFAFSTHLVYVSPLMSRSPWQETWRGLRQSLINWSGGTRIADSLTELRAGFPHLLRPNSALLILSDGLDTGEPDRIAGEMAYLRRSCGQILWLNPLAAHPEFAPLARGMAAALPYLDRLGAGHNLEALVQGLSETDAGLKFHGEML